MKYINVLIMQRLEKGDKTITCCQPEWLNLKLIARVKNVVFQGRLQQPLPGWGSLFEVEFILGGGCKFLWRFQLLLKLVIKYQNCVWKNTCVSTQFWKCFRISTLEIIVFRLLGWVVQKLVNFNPGLSKNSRCNFFFKKRWTIL